MCHICCRTAAETAFTLCLLPNPAHHSQPSTWPKHRRSALHLTCWFRGPTVLGHIPSRVSTKCRNAHCSPWALRARKRGVRPLHGVLQRQLIDSNQVFAFALQFMGAKSKEVKAEEAAEAQRVEEARKREIAEEERRYQERLLQRVSDANIQTGPSPAAPAAAGQAAGGTTPAAAAALSAGGAPSARPLGRAESLPTPQAHHSHDRDRLQPRPPASPPPDDAAAWRRQAGRSSAPQIGSLPPQQQQPPAESLGRTQSLPVPNNHNGRSGGQRSGMRRCVQRTACAACWFPSLFARLVAGRTVYCGKPSPTDATYSVFFFYFAVLAVPRRY